MQIFDTNQPKPNANRSRLSGVAKTLTFGAQTGRGSENGCVSLGGHMSRGLSKLIRLVDQLAQSVTDHALPYLGLQIIKLESG